VGPPETIVRAVRVGNIITLVVMMPVVRNPLDRMSLNSKDSPESKDVLKPLVCLETLVSELSMERHCNAEAIEKVAEGKKFEHACAVGEWGG